MLKLFASSSRRMRSQVVIHHHKRDLWYLASPSWMLCVVCALIFCVLECVFSDDISCNVFSVGSVEAAAGSEHESDSVGSALLSSIAADRTGEGLLLSSRLDEAMAELAKRQMNKNNPGVFVDGQRQTDSPSTSASASSSSSSGSGSGSSSDHDAQTASGENSVNSPPSAASFFAHQASRVTSQISDAVELLRNSFTGSGTSQAQARSTQAQVYDYIVVGGGAAGSPAARTLADAGKEVLLIERGSLRNRRDTPNAMDIYGAGVAIGDRDISQLVITKQGVRSHIGTVMGGGTSINMAIMIEETDTFFHFLEKTYPNVKWDLELIRESYDWISARVASAMTFVQPYGDAWKQGLAQVGFDPNGGYSTSASGAQIPEVVPSVGLQTGNIWQGMSLFNASDGFYRNAADVLLGYDPSDLQGGFGSGSGGGGGAGVGSSSSSSSSSSGESPPAFASWLEPRPATLTVMAGHTVQRVEFEHQFATGASQPPDGSASSSSTPSVPRAVCVVYRNTQASDVSTINSRMLHLMGMPLPDWASWLSNLFDPLRSLQSIIHTFRPASLWETEKRACVREGGQIILSAGAVLTPTILYKSGIGPRKQIEELGVQLVKEFPGLGQNISDRVLIPVGMFRDGVEPPQGFPTRICQAIGAKLSGPGCENYEIGGRNLRCSFTPAEELSGAHIGENVIYATRYIFPPEHRNEPLVEYIFNVVTACADGKYPYNSVVMASACVLAQPVIDCFRRVVANFYFSAEPKSRGTIRMSKAGDIFVDPNYMTDKQDLFDAVRGVSNIIRVVNSDVYRGVIQAASSDSCPVTILNGFLDLILQFGSSSRPLVDNEFGQFDEIYTHIEDLLPPTQRRERSAKPLSSTNRGKVREDEGADGGTEVGSTRSSGGVTQDGKRTSSEDEDWEDRTPPQRGKEEKKNVRSGGSSSFSVDDGVSVQAMERVKELEAEKEERIKQLLADLEKEYEHHNPSDDDSSSSSHSSDTWDDSERDGSGSEDESSAKTTAKERKRKGKEHDDRRLKHTGGSTGTEDSSKDSDEDRPKGQKKRNKTKKGNTSRTHGEGAKPTKQQNKEEEASKEPQEDPYAEISNLYAKSRADLQNEEGPFKAPEWRITKSPRQWVASYPPTLPDPDRPADVAKYVLSYMTSIWHFTGSAPMGEVVDDSFNVIGIDGLSIIDASVLNQVTRMNPTATLMMLGRYAAKLKLSRSSSSQSGDSNR